MSADIWLERARSAVGTATMYWAGAGGMDPGAPHPGSDFLLIDMQRYPRGTSLAVPHAAAATLEPGRPIDYASGALKLRACDCSGFVCWVLAVPRQPVDRPGAAQRRNVWINTDSIWRDASPDGPQAWFTALPRARPGCLAVYPKPADGRERYGHVAFVAAVDGDGRPTRYIHCSADNYAAGLDAILENGAPMFERHAAATRYAWLKGAPED
jgi:hypothetical protein